MELLGSSVTETSPVYYLVIYSFLVSRSRLLAKDPQSDIQLLIDTFISIDVIIGNKIIY